MALFDAGAEALRSLVALAVGGAVSWLVTTARVDAKLEKLRAALSKTDSETAGELSLFRERHAASHSELDQRLLERFRELEEKIADAYADLSNWRDQSKDDFAKEAAVAKVFVEVNEQLRNLLADVSRLEGTVQTLIGLERRPRRS
jgi:hypothetical protein